ncbi:MAG: type II secretion system F family protein [Phycicoccus sp.]|nr:type II secretion system F family protein [Phycicoccus sp.]
MTGLMLGLVFGVGLFLIWRSFWVTEPSVKGRRRPAFVLRFEDDIVQSGLRGVSVGGVAASIVCLFLLTFLLGYVLVGTASIAAAFAAIVAAVPWWFVRHQARARRTRLRDVWPDAIDHVTSGVRAGLALPEALAQLGVRGPEELRPAFIAFGEDYRLTGRFNECLDRLKARLSDPVGDRLVESLRIAREVGGSDLGRLLRTLSGFLREDARTRAELETRQSWTVNAARLAAAAPWLLLAALSTRPEAVAAYSSVTGGLVLLSGAAMSALAYWLMLQLGRLPEDERVIS